MDTQIGLGLAAVGRPQYINVGRKQRNSIDKEVFRKKGLEFINHAYDNGIRYFDVAPGYGIAESMLIEWVQYAKPSGILIATKWGYTYAADLELNAQIHEVKTHTLEKLNEQWDVSSQLLPSLKVYQIHSATFDTGVLESQSILDRLFELKETHGLEIGITTTGDNQNEVLEHAMNIQREGNDLFTAFQVTFNVFDQSTAEVCGELLSQRKKVIIKEALANGRVFRNPAFTNHQQAYDFFDELSQEHGVGVDAIALRFCMQSLSPDVVLSGASEPAHLQSNLKAYSFSLTSEQMEQLRRFKTDPTDYWMERKKLDWN